MDSIWRMAVKAKGRVAVILIPVAFALALGNTMPGVASSQELNDLARRQAFDFEQCANACQIQFDENLFSCGEYRMAEDGLERPECRSALDENYRFCLRSCPVDPGRMQQ